MIRVFNPTDRDFTSNGDAVIVPIKARVKNNVNGEFTLELTAESRFYDYLTQGNIIIAPTPQGEQAFRINNQVQRKGDRITVKARHVFYDCENLVIADSYAVDLTCEQALNHFNAATDSISPFKMHSDVTGLNTFRCVRKSLGEAIGTVIERWGGYLVRNNWDISVNKSIGRDLGVTIRYAKNLNELTASYDFSGVATKILPVGKDGILLPELYVYSTVQYSTPYTKAVTISQDINEDDYTTEEEYQAAVIADLRAQAQTLVNKTCYPVITYSLKGKPEKVQDIGDVIQVIDERIGVNITTQVIGYEWDIITESYANLTFGNFGNTLSGLMAKVNSNTKGIVQESVGEVKTEVKNSIDKIYDLLQGSYVVYRGYDILLLDTIPIGAATHVIKFSKDGILVSNNGVNGTFTKVYDITTQRLSVPSISLNGADLGTTLNSKLEATDLVAGQNITITRNGRKQIISAASGSLKYFKETNKSLYGVQDLSTPRFVCDPDYYFDYAVTEHLGQVSDPKIPIRKANDIPCIACSSDFLLPGKTIPFDANTVGWLYGGGIIWVSPDPEGTRYIVSDTDGTDVFEGGYFYGNNHVPNDARLSNYAYQFTYADTTWYASCYAYNSGMNFTALVNDGHIIRNDWQSMGEDTFAKAVARLMNGVNIAVNKTAYSGLSRTTDLALFIGGTDANGTDAPIKFYGDGSYEGIAEDKQDKLTAGANIHIAQDGTISATDTTYSAFVGTDGQTAGSAGLVPAPTVNDANKYLKGDGTWAAGGGGGSSVIANPSGTPTETLQTVEIDGTIYEIEGGASGGGGISSEIIEIATGDGTTSRTFTFSQTPKRIAISWYEGDGVSDWASSYTFTWGDHRAYGFGGNSNSATSGQYPKVASITYGQNGKSFTITAPNAGSACNSSGANDHGYLWADYGNGGAGGIESLADYTWTEILSTNGASGALPSNYNKLLFMAYYAGTVQVYKVIDVAEMKKAMTETSATKYSMSWAWNDNHGNYDTSYFYYDGTNVSIASGYSGVGCKLFAANVNSSGSNVRYSTDEQVAGEWIDGRPIYMKCFQLSNYQLARSAWTIINDVEVPNIDDVIEITVSGYDNANNQYPALGGLLSMRFNGNKLQYYLNVDYPIYVKTIILRYTKTTD